VLVLLLRTCAAEVGEPPDVAVRAGCSLPQGTVLRRKHLAATAGGRVLTQHGNSIEHELALSCYGKSTTCKKASATYS
jgi:hypothetical protein